MVIFTDFQIPQQLTGNLYQTKNEERLKQLFILEQRVYDTFDSISSARSQLNPASLSLCAEALRRVLVPFFLYIEPLVKEKAKTIGHDYWTGEMPDGGREFYLGMLDIPNNAEWSNVSERKMHGISSIVELPERLSYGIKSTVPMMGFKTTEIETVDTVIPYDSCLRAFRLSKAFLERVQLNLFIEDKLPWEIHVPGYNDENFIDGGN